MEKAMKEKLKWIQMILWLAVIVGCVLVLSKTAFAEEFTMHFEWEYATTYPNMKGFKIYTKGQSLPTIDIPDPAKRTIDKALMIAPAGTCFIMTAYDDKGVESKKSLEYCVTHPPPSPAIKKISVFYEIAIPALK